MCTPSELPADVSFEVVETSTEDVVISGEIDDFSIEAVGLSSKDIVMFSGIDDKGGAEYDCKLLEDEFTSRAEEPFAGVIEDNSVG